MPPRVEAESQPESVQISFGTLFTVLRFGIATERVDCITDIGVDTYFHAGQVSKSKRGKDMIVFTGTGGPEVFGEVVGQMPVEDVVEAFREGARDGGEGVFTDETERRLMESARKGVRSL